MLILIQIMLVIFIWITLFSKDNDKGIKTNKKEALMQQFNLHLEKQGRRRRRPTSRSSLLWLCDVTQQDSMLYMYRNVISRRFSLLCEYNEHHY